MNLIHFSFVTGLHIETSVFEIIFNLKILYRLTLPKGKTTEKKKMRTLLEILSIDIIVFLPQKSISYSSWA